jgi:hypothetical protein
MEPSQLIVWALCIGMAWLILISLTGLDDWLKSLFGRRNKTGDLEARVAKLEKRLDDLNQK